MIRVFDSEARVALAVDTFLGYTNAWIYRQLTGIPSRAKLVLCHGRNCEDEFPFDPVAISTNNTPQIFKKIRGKLWPFFKHFPPRLSTRQRLYFKNTLLENKINLVHAHFATVGSKYAALCYYLNIPLIITVHGFDITSAPKRWPAYEKLLHELWHQCPFFIVISKEMGRRLAELGCPEDRIRVSYLGVPLDDFPFVNRYGRSGPIRFLHCGRLVSKKGVPDLVRAYALAFPHPTDVVLDIVGDGEQKFEVEQAIKEASPANPINLLGMLSTQEVANILPLADIFVLNSRTDEHGTTEGLPISTLEAACTGLPAISTRHAGIPESIIEGKTGILVDEKDNAALSDAMKKLVNPQLRLAMGRAAREFMETKFDLIKCNRILGELYVESICLYANDDKSAASLTHRHSSEVWNS